MENIKKNYRSIWTSLRETSFEQAFVDVNGVRTRYVHAGKKGNPAVVMVHGTAGHWEAFSANLQSLSTEYDCYALDMVGCGFSDKPDQPLEIKDYMLHLLGFMDVMGLQRVSLVGVSLGAWVSAAIAKEQPSRVEKLVLLSASGLFSSSENRERIKSQRTKAVDEPSWENIKSIFNKLIADEDNRIDDLISLRQAIYRLPEMKAGILNILVLQDPEIRARNLLDENSWRSITTPTLVVGSLEDKDEYLKTAKVVSGLIPDAVYVDMPGVGHWPQFEDPHTFNEMCLDFLKRG